MTTYLVVLVVVLACFNNVTNAVELPGWTYVPLNLAFAGVLVWSARWHGSSWDELGLGRAGWGPGLAVGAVFAVVVAAALAMSFVVPAAERFLDDTRVARLDTSGLLYTVLLRIPLGTAILEEVAFRGVLYGTWRRVASVSVAAVGSCAIFGLWHIVPTLELLRTNSFTGSGLAKAGLVTLGVIGTALGGGFLLLLRVRTRGVVGPVIVHAATNSFATLAAYVWQRR